MDTRYDPVLPNPESCRELITGRRREGVAYKTLDRGDWPVFDIKGLGHLAK